MWMKVLTPSSCSSLTQNSRERGGERERRREREGGRGRKRNCEIRVREREGGIEREIVLGF